MSLMELTDVHKTYTRGGFLSRQQTLSVLNGVSLSLEPGQCLGLLGRSGAGKSTLSRIVLGLESPDSGKATYEGTPIPLLKKAAYKDFRRNVQVVFQNALGSVNPRFTAGEIIQEPLDNFLPMTAGERRQRIGTVLEQVGLSAGDADKYPHQFSGGELQRVCIARAIALSPKLIVLDEAVSSLDMVIQARIIDLLTDLQHRMGMAYLFISHDIRVLQRMADSISILHEGRIVDTVQGGNALTACTHPELQRLFSAILPPLPPKAV